MTEIDVERLARIIAQLDEEEPFLAGEIDTEELSIIVSPRGVAERIAAAYADAGERT